MRAVDETAAGEFERGLIDGVLLVHVVQRRLEREDEFDQSGHVLRHAVVARPERRLGLAQDVVRHQVSVVATRRRDGLGRRPRLGVNEPLVRLGDVVESLYGRLQFG